MNRPLDKAITQRTVLGFVSSVFDPVGLVAETQLGPVFCLKIFGQLVAKVWTMNCRKR